MSISREFTHQSSTSSTLICFVLMFVFLFFCLYIIHSVRHVYLHISIVHWDTRSSTFYAQLPVVKSSACADVIFRPNTYRPNHQSLLKRYWGCRQWFAGHTACFLSVLIWGKNLCSLRAGAGKVRLRRWREARSVNAFDVWLIPSKFLSSAKNLLHFMPEKDWWIFHPKGRIRFQAASSKRWLTWLIEPLLMEHIFLPSSPSDVFCHVFGIDCWPSGCSHTPRFASVECTQVPDGFLWRDTQGSSTRALLARREYHRWQTYQ